MNYVVHAINQRDTANSFMKCTNLLNCFHCSKYISKITCNSTYILKNHQSYVKKTSKLHNLFSKTRFAIFNNLSSRNKFLKKSNL